MHAQRWELTENLRRKGAKKDEHRTDERAIRCVWTYAHARKTTVIVLLSALPLRLCAFCVEGLDRIASRGGRDCSMTSIRLEDDE
jgi:hypothetical protein